MSASATLRALSRAVSGSTRVLPVLLTGALWIAAMRPAYAEGEESDAVAAAVKASLLDLAPSALSQLMRYPKYYADPSFDSGTIDGPILARQYLLGSFGGERDSLAKKGWIFDFGVTQALQGVVSGDGDGATYFGSADLWAAFDSGRAGLWPGGLVYVHLEGDWGHAVEGTSALLPVNGDTIMPGSPSKLALSEVVLFQGLPGGFAILGGKVNWADLADKSFFANDERNQFLYEGLINNVLLGGFVPYTSLGGAISKQFGEEVVVAALATSNATNALSAGFDEFGASDMTYAVAVTWTPTFNGLPGLYDFLAGYTTKAVLAFDIDPRYLLGEIIGVVPIAQKDDNYAVAFGGSQYLWVDKDAHRSDGLPVGIGVFFRLGFEPKDRNVIDQFYSCGVGGNGGVFHRVDDSWGVGWAGSHISGDLRRDAGLLGVAVENCEHAIEAFYNAALTPAARLSFHFQWIAGANGDLDDAVVLATRLQLDF